MSSVETVHLFVIGAGSGGVRAARLASMAGAKVVVAESFRVGGTCVIRGCVPKKLYVYGAEFAQAFRLARGYGWAVPEPAHDWARMREAVASEVDRLSAIYTRNLRNAGVEIVESFASLLGEGKVGLADGRVFRAGRILVATGGGPWRPSDVPGQELGITSDDVFHLPSRPERLVVAGGGYSAIEFAHIFAALGTQVTLVYRGETVLNGFDDDVRVEVHENLKRAGVRVITHTVIERVEQTAGGLAVHLVNGEHVEADQLLWAVGRRAATAGLGLETAGVALDARGNVTVDAHSRTSAPGIFAVGDVTGRMPLTPVAIREAQAFVDTEYRGRPSAFTYDDIPTAVFAQPAVGVVGLSEAEARRRHGAIDIYKTRFRPMKHVLPNDETRMLMKLVVCAQTQRVVGCHIVGPDAPEIIQAVAIAVKAGLTKAQFDDTCALHPSVAEELVTLREKWVAPNLASA
jgi:glutathione reductase (NADPH)